VPLEFRSVRHRTTHLVEVADVGPVLAEAGLDSLEEADDLYPQIEEEFQAALDTSLNPRGPETWLVILARHQKRPS
jgi:hypothetical protein